MRIWKYPLQVTDEQAVPMPIGSQLMTVQMQNGTPCLWALVDETRNPSGTVKRIAIYGTGNPIPDDPGRYIATFQMSNGALVFHAFELQ